MATILLLGGIGGWKILLSYAIIFLLPLIALINCVKSDWNDTTKKLIWVIIIIVIPIIGAILPVLCAT